MLSFRIRKHFDLVLVQYLTCDDLLSRDHIHPHRFESKNIAKDLHDALGDFEHIRLNKLSGRKVIYSLCLLANISSQKFVFKYRLALKRVGYCA